MHKPLTVRQILIPALAVLLAAALAWLILALQPADSPAAVPAPADGYTVTVADEDGTPVPGVTVQICTDSLCLQKTTDEKGRALFGSLAPGTYEFHIPYMPENLGPAAPVPETTSPEETDIRVTLRRVGP